MEHLIENANEVLRNRKIKFIRYMTEQEANGMGWYKRPIVMVLDNGTMIYLSSDDEGVTYDEMKDCYLLDGEVIESDSEAYQEMLDDKLNNKSF